MRAAEPNAATVVVLAMHGVPPRDFPRAELVELLSLESRVEVGSGGGVSRAPLKDRSAMGERLRELDEKVRRWPRTPENDPFHAASQELGSRLSRELGLEVIVAFNEFCAPRLDEALDRAIAGGARRVIVATAMMTRGGEHSEVDIPAAIARARERHPMAAFVYAWPFDGGQSARFLADQIERFI